MSIVNFWIHAQRAIVGADTAAGTAGGDNIAGFTVSKFRYIQRLNAIICHAGTVRFGLYAALWCDSMLNLDLDGLVKELPAQLPKIFRKFVEDEIANGVPAGEPSDAQHVALVGWSEQLGKMIARGWTQESRDTGFREMVVEPSLVTPWAPEMRPTAVPNTVARMIELARAQRDWAREHHPRGSSIGGHFIVAELTRWSCKIEDVYDLDADAARVPEQAHAAFAIGGGALFGAPPPGRCAGSSLKL